MSEDITQVLDEEGQELIPHTTIDEHFCRVFVATLSPDKAAVAVGAEAKNATVLGIAKLRDPVIAARVAELFAVQAKELDIQANQLIFELKSIAHSDIGDMLNASGGIKRDIGSLKPHIRKAIKSLQIDETVDQNTGKVTKRRFKVVLWDKLKAADMLGRTIDLFNERGAHKLPSLPPLEETDVLTAATRVSALLEKGEKLRAEAEVKDKGEDLV